MRTLIRQKLCPLIHGSHEFYRINEPADQATSKPARIYQKCLLCQFETPGWNLTREQPSKIEWWEAC